ncbi:hypothetical protein SPRG_02937 [Saprolegnia parasitica CBS 223.65]|uniref:Peptidase M14 domain-containing protein n=1 Tax=Saprolegnia parasitica (strain CBS 223.65) TaxID=695850 RepID=A0A067CT71_SAPPC|nr:hypothetical protein SPRG_02937 [Saprolegnia parasitica CBS 223.65]KDO32460.1 hypothetical protein SPRG_02937 [Saprolegnia parasitica CBS 223.65]|eukprot:XP_012196911.1 hypothetical protein SPRG_02937 [Saprolegnia parasitica CBS 223.65]
MTTMRRLAWLLGALALARGRPLHEAANATKAAVSGTPGTGDCAWKRAWAAKLDAFETSDAATAHVSATRDALTLSATTIDGAVASGWATYPVPRDHIPMSGKLVVQATLAKGLGLRPTVKLVKSKDGIHRDVVVLSGVGEQPDGLQIRWPHATSASLHMKAFPCIDDLTLDSHTFQVTWDDGWFRWFVDDVFYLEQHRTSFFAMTAGYTYTVHVELAYDNATSHRSSNSNNVTIDASMVVSDISLYKQTSPACTPSTTNPSDCSNYITRAILPTVPQGSLRGSLSFSEVLEYVEAIPARLRSFPYLFQQVDIGTSLEGRPLRALCLGQCHPQGKTPPQTLYTGLHHARENLVYFVEYLLLGFHQRDPNVLHLLLTRQLWFVLVVNPDGYVYNEKHLETLHFENPSYSGQRKNRRPATCRTNADVGVDLNRNYDVCFDQDTVGSSTDACAEDYRGEKAFSEPETRAIRDFVANHSVATALNYHAFGKYVNIPFACQPKGAPAPADMAIFSTIASEMTKYNHFHFGQSWQTSDLYSVNGETSDWMWNAHGIFAMSPETGPSFDYGDVDGFWPTKASIVHEICEELLYTNFHAARIAGPIYTLRLLGWENDDDYVTLSLELQNVGLTSVASAEVLGSVHLNGSTASAPTTMALAALSKPDNQVQTMTLDIPKPTKTELAPPAVYVLLRDADACHLYRVSLGKKSDEFALWEPLSLPRCGTCATFGALNATAAVTCDGLEDVVEILELPTLSGVTNKALYSGNLTLAKDLAVTWAPHAEPLMENKSFLLVSLIVLLGMVTGLMGLRHFKAIENGKRKASEAYEMVASHEPEPLDDMPDDDDEAEPMTLHIDTMHAFEEHELSPRSMPRVRSPTQGDRES